jgi:pyruvate formate lyase activating enzyme
VNVKGIYRTSLIDYPGAISAVVFTGGCNLRCKFCHNPELALDSSELESIPEAEILSFLSTRKRLIDGVVISGGEPTLRENLPGFCDSLKSLGFKVKLDTNGSSPSVVAGLLRKKTIDYFALDMKTSPSKYPEVTASSISFDSVYETLDLLRSSGTDYELRTTCVPDLVTMDDFAAIGERIGRVKNYYLQQFRSENTLDGTLSGVNPYRKEQMAEFRDFVSTFSDRCELRGV